MSFWDLFKKQKPKLTDVRECGLEVDLHSHLIPGIDDGAKDLEDSLRMLRTLQDLGYRKAITTPHIMGDFYKNTPETILGGLEEVRAAMADEEDLTIELEAAAEYYLDEWFPEKLEAGNLLTFGENYLLVETNYTNRPHNLDQMLFDIQVQGYQPILAHPERYIYLYPDFEKVKELTEKGVLLQVNLMSFIGYYSPEARMCVEKLATWGLIHFIGTDIHSMKHVSPLKRGIGTELFLQVCQQQEGLFNKTL